MDVKNLDLYLVDTEDWNLNSLFPFLLDEELREFEKIQCLQTFRQKVVARALLRFLLAEKYAIPISELTFSYNSRGKPFLEAPSHTHFNYSHSASSILLGMCDELPIGVDIEFQKPLDDEEDVAKAFFNEVEFNYYLQRKQKHPFAFFEFWTAKEALIKALGKGIWEKEGLPNIIEYEGLLHIGDNNGILRDWTLIFPPVFDKYTACIAIQRPRIDVSMRELNQPDVVTRSH